MRKIGSAEAADGRSLGRRHRSAVSLISLGVMILAVGLWVGMRARPAKARVPSLEEVVDRGRYLVTITSCNDCHTPFKLGPNGPEPDMSRMLSGHPEDIVIPELVELPAEPWGFMGSNTNTAFLGPWGVSYAFNLTPDVNTGIGVWSEEIFINTLRSGRHWGVARPILPPMPWQFIGQMTDEDLKAVYAYLRTIPPIHNRVPEARPAPDPAG